MPFRSRRTVVKIAVVLLALAVTAYLATLVALVVLQRSMMYFPAGARGPATAYGLPNAKTLDLKTSDGETIVAWYQPAEAGKPLLLYFHGNGGTLASRNDYLRALSKDGSGFLAIDYRGYGGSTGSPNETGLMIDGETAYAEAQKLGYGPDRIVIIGESLGTAVAIDVAARHRVRALVLDSVFSSATDIAAGTYWMFPVRLLMWDAYDSFSKIAGIAAPKLFLHATGDPVIPFANEQKVYDEARPPKTLITVPDAGHIVLWRPDIMARMKAWLAALPRYSDAAKH